MIRIIGILATFLIFSSSCGRDVQQPATELFEGVNEPKPLTQKEAKMGLSAADNYSIKMSKDALGKKYLLSMSTIPQKEAATSTGLAAKVVTFKQFGNTIDMYEVNDGNVVTDNLPAQTLLAQFPVTTSTASTVTIDFGKGMNDVYTSIWYGGNGNFSSGDATLDVRASRVFEVKKDGDLLLIRHSILARSSSIFGQMNMPLEMRYYLSSYQPTRFPSKEVGKLEQVGFFGVPTKLEKNTGRPVDNAIRFDISKPVKFYYSANTPADYVEAVKDGVLYWNKAFGKKVVEVAAAPAGVTAPNPKYNVVQWVEWDEAGFAYADVLANPLTGESLHGQVYMTSVFAFKSKDRVRRLIRLLSATAETKEEKKEGFVVPNFTQPIMSCHRYQGKAFAQGMLKSLNSILGDEKVTEEAILRVSQDYIREVIAHEIGHVLGLRHNFAGTDNSNMTPNEKKTWLDAYLRNSAKIEEGKYPVTTVMDYSAPIDAYYAGWYIRESKKALPYDEAAIRWGYFDERKVENKDLLFCTDDHVASFADCNRFDQGPAVAAVTLDQIASAVKGLPVNVIEGIIAKKTAYHPSLQVKVEQQSLNPALYASQIVAPLVSFLDRLDSSKRIVAVDRTFDYVGPLTQEAILQARWDMLNEELKEVGGIENVMFSFLPASLAVKAKENPTATGRASSVSAAKWTKSFNELLDSDLYSSFIGGNKKKGSFTDGEKEYLKKTAKVFFAKVEEKVVTMFLTALQKRNLNLGTAANGGLVRDEDFTNKIQTQVASLVEKVVMSPSKERRPITGTLSGAGVWVKPYLYDQSTRELAASTFSSLKGNYEGWSEAPKKALGAKFKTSVQGSLNVSKIKDFKDSMLSPSIYQWYKNQKKIGLKLGTSL